MALAVHPTSREILLPEDDVIVSKTDLKGRITYANRTFCQIAGYTEAELLGAPHSIVRHPDMPRAVFKLLWDTLLGGQEIFAYVKNMTKTGDFYWVFAHVTPSYDGSRNMIGFHSNRRAPDRRTVSLIEALYRTVLAEEQQHKNGQRALAAGFDRLTGIVTSKGMPYEELIFAL